MHSHIDVLIQWITVCCMGILHHSICMCLHENAIQFDDCRISVFEVRVQVKFGKLARIYLF